MRKIRPLAERFWEKVDVKEPNECWPWSGGKTLKGYGVFYITEWKHAGLAHRVAYELHHDVKLPRGKTTHVLHTCDNPGCTNPNHLRFDTCGANMRDAFLKGRKRRDIIPDNRGIRHYAAVLTDELVVKLRKQFANGKPMKQIKQETGLSYGALGRMLHRQTWKHLP